MDLRNSFIAAKFFHCCVLIVLCLLAAGHVTNCSYDRDIYLNDTHVPRCPEDDALAKTLFFVYILTTSIMLINLLIAIFRF